MKKFDGYKLFKIVVLVIFVLSLVPLVYLGRYNFNSVDDFRFGRDTHAVILAGGSLSQVLRAAWATVIYYWHYWQGTYFSIFLMALQPGIWGEGYYFLTSVLMLGMLIFGTYFFLNVLMHKGMGVAKSDVWVLTALLLLTTIQTITDANQGFYWFNGAVHYMFMHGFALFLLGFMLLFADAKGKTRNIGYFLLVLLGSALLAGANFVTALTFVLVYILYFMHFGWQRNWKAFWLLIPFAVYMVGFVLNVTAPGNATRQVLYEQPSVVEAIIDSFKYGILGMNDFLNLVVFLFVLICVPIIWRLLSKAEFTFYHPALVAVISFCFACAMYAPTTYAQGAEPALRVKDIIQATEYLLLFLNIVNAEGYVLAKMRSDEKLMQQVENWLSQKQMQLLQTCMVFVLFAILLFGIWGMNGTTPQAIYCLRDGQAQQYAKEVNNRLKKYAKHQGEDVTVKEYSVKPELLYMGDIKKDKTAWRNEIVKDYYGLNSVTLKKRKKKQ